MTAPTPSTPSTPATSEQPENAVAIVGLSCRFPGAPDADAFWRLTRDGGDGGTRFSRDELLAAGVPAAELDAAGYVPVSYPLAGYGEFDAKFFGCSPAEARLMDPQHRLALQTCWQALEQAGYPPTGDPDPFAVFLSGSGSAYLEQRVLPQAGGDLGSDELQRALGTDLGMLALRVSYKLNLTGPSLSVQTACSSSLVAVHLAVQSLLTRESDLALAGGVAVRLLDPAGYRYEEGSILSADGTCRPFDAAADGTVSGDGVGVVVLKRLEDAIADGDHIEAVVLGSAVNNDGAAKVGFTAPSSAGQARVIAEAQAVAGVGPASIQYVEAHGTGTLLGDPIETQALAEVFGSARRSEPALLGSVKAGIGHLDAAAGVAGLIRTALALRHGQVPGTAHFHELNPQLALDPALFRVTAETVGWPAGHPRRAGVSAFGVGGTNAHLVLQAAPARPGRPGPPEPLDEAPAALVLPLSGRGPAGLLRTAAALADRLAGPDGGSGAGDEPALADVAYTLQQRRRPLTARAVVVARDRAEAVTGLRALTVAGVSTPATDPNGAAPAVVFLFPGQGSQFAGMGADLYRQEPVFRAAMDACAEAFGPHLDWDVREAAFGADEDRLRQTEYTQPTVFSIGYALARMLGAAGVEPAAMIGHSLGEYVAATLAGVFTLADAATVVAARGALMQKVEAGRMISVALAADELAAVVEGHGTIAALNAPQLCVLAGSEAEIAVAEKLLAGAGAPARPLATSHAFHTAMLDAVRPEFEAVVASVTRSAPRRPFVSNLTGLPITAEQATAPGYWGAHLREPVRFAPGLAGLLEAAGPLVLVELGPGSALSGMARLAELPPGAGTRPVIVAGLPRDSAQRGLWSLPGDLWRAGVEVDWAALGADREPGRVVPLPGIAFEPEVHLLPKPEAAAGPAGMVADPAGWTWTPVWHRCRPAPVLPGTGTWLVIEDEAGLARRVAAVLRERGHRVETAAALTGPEPVLRLVRDLVAAGTRPDGVIHAGAVLAPAGLDPAPGDLEAGYEKAQQHGVLGLIGLVQALAETGTVDGLRIVTLTDSLQDVAGTAPRHPERATVHGAVPVLPQEFTGLRCRSVDVELPAGDEARDEAGWDRLAALVATEVLADAPGGDRFISYRNGIRWRQDYAPVELADDPAVWSGAGGYLITGASTEAGLMTAGALAATGARLVLVERPATAAGPAGNPERASRLAALVAADPERVSLVTADLTDAAQVRAAVRAAGARLGRVDGTFHLPDERAAGMVAVKTAAEAMRTLDARVRSTLLLSAALDQLDQDGPEPREQNGFLLLGSSVTGVVGGFGQLENCAVATFLDSFAQSRSTSARPVVTLDWGQWCWDDWFEQQMADLPAVRADYAQLRRRYGIPVVEGLARTRAALAGALTSVVVSTRDFRAVRAEQAQLTAAQFSAALAGPVADPGDGADAARLWPGDEVAQQVAAVWREMLGVTLTEPDTDFYTVGGNSLFAIQVVARLRQLYGSLPMSVVFEAPTVPALAAAIRTHLTGQLGDNEMDRMLREVEALSAEELEALLAGDDE